MRTIPFFSSLALFVASATLLHATPLLEKTDLFTGGQGGSSLYRIPGIVVTMKGTVLAYCEARRTSGADWGEIEVQLRRSTDGGRTWDAPRHIAHKGPRIEGNPHKPTDGAHEQTVNNPVAIVDKDGTIHFLYCINYARCFYMKSADDGLTFSTPVEITAAFEAFRPRCPWNVLATGPGHGIQIKSGRLVVPIWLAYGTHPGAHAPSMAGTIYSDDHGTTWKAGAISAPNEGELKNPNESTVVELSDGRVMMNSRSVSRASRRLITTSPDGATGWSTPYFENALWEPICMAGLVGLPQKPGTLLFSNPHSLEFDPATGQPLPGARGKRRNVSIKLSRDDGKTWPVNRTLEEGSSAYSDLAILPDETVLCFYERDKRLTIARFNLEWLTEQAPTAVTK